MATRRIADSGVLIGLITKALSERFAKDPCKPGILISHLPEGKRTESKKLQDFAAAGGMQPFDPYTDGWTTFVIPKPRISDMLASTPEPVFYVAAHRYTGPYAEGREIVAKAYDSDLDTALLAVAREICPSTEAQQDLEAFLRKPR